VKRDLLALTDLGPQGLHDLLDRAGAHARARGGDTARDQRPLAGRSVALLFEKPSTRTRLALEVATVELGGHPVVIASGDSQVARGEAVEDTARVLGRTVFLVAYRTGPRARLLAMARACRAPVVNALSDDGHPLQVLADLYAVRAERGRLHGLRYAFIGDAGNVARSWIEAAGLLGLELTLACPEGFGPPAGELEQALAAGGRVAVTVDPIEAARGADVVITDVWVSMGQESAAEERKRRLAGYRITRALLAHAAPEAKVLHCLPAHRGEEIEAEVIDGPRSLVWEAVGARLHVTKAALVWAAEERNA
jgi:ornithine carbamoyltransferase